MGEKGALARLWRSAVMSVAIALLAGMTAPAVLAAVGPDFTIEPSNTVVDVPFAPQPVVAIKKGANIDTNATGTISLAIGANPGGGTLTCDGGNSKALLSGVADFAGRNCRISAAGVGYTLVATWVEDGSSTTSAAFTVTGPATKLAFTGQPGGGAAGAVWAAQPVVTVQDSAGRTVTTGTAATAAVTLAIGTNPGGGTLTCTGGLSKNAVNGVATFSGCKIDRAGVGYTLVASSGSLTSATSNPFTVSDTTATKLAFITQPARGIPGIALAVQPVVTVQDAVGNTVTSSTATVTLAIGANPGGGALSCSGGLSKAAVNGVATFSRCSINAVGVGYTLTAASAGLTGATSALFDVADRLVFTTQPAGAAAGTAFTTQPVVAVRAGPTNTATHDNGTAVTLAIQSGTGAAGAILTCTGGLTKTAFSGVATFTGCKIDKASPTSPANPYRLVASATNLLSATSNTLVVSAGPATKLGFIASPSAATAGQAFPTQPVVAIQDAGGNTVTVGADATKTVTIALGTNPGGGVLTCTGGLSKGAVAGLATFAGCSINSPGVGYTLRATATGLTAATSAAFSVAPGNLIVVSASASAIVWGGGDTIGVQFTNSGANRVVTLQGTRDGVTWTTITSLVTDLTGHASLFYRPVTNLWYRAVFAGAPDLGGATSNSTRVVVRQKVSMIPTSSLTRIVSRGASVTFTTTVRPARPELPKATVRFQFYRLVSGAWSLAGLRLVQIDSLGQARTTWTFSSSGSWQVRSRADPTTYNANSFWTRWERYDAR